jgi:hypothetical protein
MRSSPQQVVAFRQLRSNNAAIQPGGRRVASASPYRVAPTMNYKTLDLKIEQFIYYVNDGKVNLIPPFQRGHVWKPNGTCQ